ncbi:MAG: UDP-N-acetyl-D-glucosamine dehydrogenase, partial [Chloroflexi bacterium]|nr:UDP-N-acetyl-D-glucosamine dehydrogenase [Chloroflexota bacterium]
MNKPNQLLMERLQDRSACVAVIGLGYVGLPLATVFAEAGFRVVGIDPDLRKVENIRQGKSHIQDVPGEQVARLVAAGKLSATSDYAAIQDAQAVSICVP